ncbi:MAG: PKD domain-containing protein [Methanomicrobiales archaeon]|nr:PKD domain-containing protein [Methanomicrobiales archaeon]
MSRTNWNDTGAAEMIGSLAIIAIIVAVIAIIAVILFSQGTPGKLPALNVVVKNQSEVITLYHDGGDPLALADFYVLVDGEQLPVALSEPGTTWLVGQSITVIADHVPDSVQVVYTGSHRPGGQVLATIPLGSGTSRPGIAASYTITASAGPGGSISPVSASVPEGGSRIFVITPDSGFVINQVIVDGVIIPGTPAEYEFLAVTTDHTIAATFVEGGPANYLITASAGPGGTLDPAPGTIPVAPGASQTFTLVPYPGYHPAAVVVNSTYSIIPVPASYTFSNVDHNQEIAVTFASDYEPGIVGTYHKDRQWTWPAATVIHNRIYFADAEANISSTHEKTDVTDWPVDYIHQYDNFSVSYDGYLKVDAAGTYTFYMRACDGNSLALDGVTLISALGTPSTGTGHAVTDYTATVSLTPGYHLFSAKMWDDTGDGVVQVEYANSSGLSRRVIDTYYHSTLASTPPTVDFTGTPLVGVAPHSVQFTDASSAGTTAWEWNFGDGQNSTAKNPLHSYATAGSYTVTLHAASPAGYGTPKTRENYVLVGGSYLPGIVGVYYANSTWTAPGTRRVDPRIWFADKYYPTDPSYYSPWPNLPGSQVEDFSVSWDGYLRIPSADTYTFHLVSDDGSYLWIDDTMVIDNGGLHAERSKYGTVTLGPGYHHIVVDMYEYTERGLIYLSYSTPSIAETPVTDLYYVNVVYPPVAQFSAATVSGSAPLTVAFTDSSTNTPTSWSWNFGDGTTSTVQNPSHTYANPGTYTVTLTAANSGGSSTVTRAGYITVLRPPPAISGVTPPSGNRGWPVSISSIAGTNFQQGATVNLTRTGYSSIEGSAVVVNPANTSISCMLDLTAAAAGTWTLRVTNPDGQSATSSFTVNSPAPVVSGITPNAGVRGWPVIITRLTGSNFQKGATVQLRRTLTGGGTITATNVTVLSPTEISCDFDLASVATWANSGGNTRAWDVRVTNAYDSQYGTGAGIFSVTNYDPTILSVTPPSGSHGTTVTITDITGTGFQPGATVQLRRSGATTITGTGVTVASPTRISSCTFVIPYSATMGTYYLRVTNPGSTGNYGDSASIFTVTAAPNPAISSITPDEHARDNNRFTVTIDGSGFQTGATVQVIGGSGGAFTVDRITRVSATQMTARFRIPTTASTGTRTIRVLNTDGSYGDLIDGFTVTA